jgi:hypothetical protein
MMSLLLAALFTLQSVPATSSSITGRVLLPDGSPASGRRVMAFEESAAASPEKTVIVGLTETDAAGNYALTDLPPGRYVIATGSLIWPTYFPGVADRKTATTIVAPAARNVTAVDIRIISDETRITPLFASYDPLSHAWAAWFAGESGNPEWAPVLEEKLKKTLANGREDIRTALIIDTLVDAMIRLDAKPSADLRQALYRRRPWEALILMSRLGSGANADLLDLLGISSDVLWAGTANVLLSNKAPGFVVRLLAPLQLSAQLIVCYSEADCPNGGFGTGGPHFGGDGGGPMELLVSGPPWPTYSLSTKGNTLLADGPIKVYYDRKVFVTDTNPRTTGLVGLDSPGAPGTPSSADLLNYIAASAPGVTLGIQVYEERKTVFKDDAQMKAEAEVFRKDILRRYASLLEQLQKAGVLTAAEAETVATPKLNLVIGGDAGRARR